MFKKVILFISLVFLLVGCSNSTKLDELKRHNTLMLVIEEQNWGMVCDDEDYWASTTYKVYYDGRLEITASFNLSEDRTAKFILDEEDYKAIVSFVLNDRDKFKDIFVDGSDGTGWTFIYYDLDGNKEKIYSGYTYGVEALENIQNIIGEYGKVY